MYQNEKVNLIKRSSTLNHVCIKGIVERGQGPGFRQGLAEIVANASIYNGFDTNKSP